MTTTSAVTNTIHVITGSTTTITILPPGVMPIFVAPVIGFLFLLFSPAVLFIYLAYVRGRGRLIVGRLERVFPVVGRRKLLFAVVAVALLLARLFR